MRAALIAWALLAALALPAAADMRSLQVTARFDGPVSLPPDAIIELRLLDVSRADAPSTELAVRRLPVTALPVVLELSYDAGAIDARMSCVVAALIRSGERVLYRTVTAYPVLTRGGSETAAILLQ